MGAMARAARAHGAGTGGIGAAVPAQVDGEVALSA